MEGFNDVIEEKSIINCKQFNYTNLENLPVEVGDLTSGKLLFTAAGVCKFNWVE
jgi:hypothetical protein